MQEAPRESWAQVLGEGRWALFLLVLGGIWLHAADSLVVATVMPAVVADLGGIAWTPWAFALYELGSIIAGAMGGLASLRLGVGRALGGFAALFALGCLASALAPSMGLFLGGRLLQGLGGGALLALSHVAVTKSFQERHWKGLFALISAVWGLASLAGPLIGGLFSDAGWWRGAFYVFAVKGTLVALAAPWLLARVSKKGGMVGQVGVPWGSLGLLTLGVLAIALAGVVHNLVLGLPLVLVGILLLAAMLRVDSFQTSALLPHGALAKPGPARDGLIMVIALSMATIGFLIYGPLLLAELHGISALTGGYIVAMESVAWTIAAMAVGRVKPAGEGFYLRLGAFVILTGLIGIAIFLPEGPLWALLPFVACQGAGFGLAFAFIIRRVVTAAPEQERDHAAGAVATAQMLGYALGAALAGIAANSVGLASGAARDDLAAGVPIIFLAFVPWAIIGVCGARRLAAAPAGGTTGGGVSGGGTGLANS
ncbi:MAG: MFS transporter [Pseudomonadota bacterium]